MSNVLSSESVNEKFGFPLSFKPIFRLFLSEPDGLVEERMGESM